MKKKFLLKFKFCIEVFSIFLLLSEFVYAKSVFFDILRGNKEFAKKKYSNAQKIFQNALIDQPLNEILHFNLGNVYYKMRKYDKALKEYEELLQSKNNKLKQQSYYNIGNSHYRMGNFLEAINSYEKALEIDPNDKQAKENLELVRKKLKHMLKRQEEKERSGQCPRKKPGIGSGQNKQEAGKKKGDEKKPGEKENKDKKLKPQQGGIKPEDKDKLSDDEARRILQKALEDEVGKNEIPLGEVEEYEAYRDW